MARVEVTMPKMGESITEGTVIVWHKQPGDAVEADETLLEIGTDKVDTEVPSPEAGTLAEILVQEGDTVDVGTAIAVLETDVEEPSAGGEQQPDAGQQAGEAAAAGDAGPEAEESESAAEVEEDVAAEPEVEEEAHLETRETGEGVEVVMPKMGESITEGTIVGWRRQVGEEVEEDEILLEIATDKVDTEVPSPAAGTLTAILVEEGETVEVGTAIARIGGAAPATEAAAAEAPPKEEKRQKAAPAQAGGDGAAAEPQEEVQSAGDIGRKSPDGRFLSPLVRSIAKEEGVTMRELQEIQGSGREGRVTKEDVLEFVEGRKQAPRKREREQVEPEQKPTSERAEKRPLASGATPTGGGAYDGRVEVIKMDRMRQIIAEHMVRSKATSAHVTSFAEADVTNLVKVRERNKQRFVEREGIKLTYTPFFVQAAVQALHGHPIFNASVDEDEIVLKKALHIGIAVAIEKKGLVAPVIQDAQDKNLVGLARAAADMAERARNKQLQPDELQGGTFTITNIGSLGSIMGTPIINQPQVSILATGAIKKRPVVIEDPDLGDIIAIRHIMYLSLSYDHRIIDGAMGASFLQKFVEVLESHDPMADL